MSDFFLSILGFVPWLANQIIQRFDSWRKVPPGPYFVTGSEKLGETETFGIVYLKKGRFSLRSYATKFLPLKPNAGKTWQGHFTLKDKMTAEGTFRYLDTNASGSHGIILIKKGVLKIIVKSHDISEYRDNLYWIRVENYA